MASHLPQPLPPCSLHPLSPPLLLAVLAYPVAAASPPVAPRLVDLAALELAPSHLSPRLSPLLPLPLLVSALGVLSHAPLSLSPLPPPPTPLWAFVVMVYLPPHLLDLAALEVAVTQTVRPIR